MTRDALSGARFLASHVSVNCGRCRRHTDGTQYRWRWRGKGAERLRTTSLCQRCRERDDVEVEGNDGTE